MMNKEEQITYNILLNALQMAQDKEKSFHLDKLYRFVEIVNIRLNQAVSEGWELP